MGPHHVEFASREPSENRNQSPEGLDSISDWSQRRKRKKFILCFDGTGNKFSGTDADSNILKIYRMLDRNDDTQFHYYQPGIGTYVTSTSLSHTSVYDRIKSAYQKSKDSAVGTSFDHHVMGGYRFLMRYYLPGDDIYLFGFSRGAYTARFLAEMLDHVGLLSAGNEEMCQFAWKTFQKWQMRQERNEKEKKEKKELLDFMMAFRETFSRPVRRIRFLGLFDTVNSVPRFENAWMQRSKFPYTARSSAKVIRHAVAIDERRAKFRQDLISQSKPDKTHCYHHRKHRRRHSVSHPDSHDINGEEKSRGRKGSTTAGLNAPGRRDTLTVPGRFQNPSESTGIRNRSPGMSVGSEECHHSRGSSPSSISFNAIHNHVGEDSDDEGEQDIQEVWFAGCHADIGGGWPLEPGEDSALSHIPLCWMVREAERAGLNFDEDKRRHLNCIDETLLDSSPNDDSGPIPQIEIDPGSPDPQRSNSMIMFNTSSFSGDKDKDEPDSPKPPSSPQDMNSLPRFHRALHSAAVRGKIHDVLQFHNGVPALSVISWNIMEYLPFRRMDLLPDGSWKSIAWPLPKGEVRDIPDDAMIHGSVIRRMECCPEYRPGNLIVGGGGRGVRKAPSEYGIGKWRTVRDEGDPVGEVVVRMERTKRMETETGEARMINVAPGGPQGVFVSGGRG